MEAVEKKEEKWLVEPAGQVRRLKTAHIQKLAISKSSTIFALLSGNLVKIIDHEVLILIKFHEDRAKIVDLLLIVNFFMCAVLLNQSLGT